jgi:hypothetical protein
LGASDPYQRIPATHLFSSIYLQGSHATIIILPSTGYNKLLRKENNEAANMNNYRRLKTCKLLLQKYPAIFSICMLLLIAGRSNGQEKDGIRRKDTLAAMSQSEREVNIRHLLNSDSLNDQAWGAYWASKYKMDAFVPPLIRLVDPLQSKKSAELLFRDLATLDSLIQFNATVPSAQLLPLYDRYPDHVLILLAKSLKENSAALLELAAKEEGSGELYWVAACNLLETAKAPGFATFLLSKIRVWINISVYEKNPKRMRVIIREDPGCWGRKIISQKSDPLVSLDWPPIDNYRLTTTGNETTSILAQGQRVIYYMKEACLPGGVFPNIGKEGRDIVRCPSSMDRLRLDYLTELLDSSIANSMPKTLQSYRIYWEDSQQFSKQVAGFCNNVQSSFKPLLNNLFSRGWLTQNEDPNAGIPIGLEVDDFREDTSVSLPAVSCDRILISQ